MSFVLILFCTLQERRLSTLNLSMYARIGKGVLTKSIGIQKNYKVVNGNGSVLYVNEKNLFGYQHSLKTNAIKLFLLYHFLQPDSNGFIQHIPVSLLAEEIGCTTATIHACNHILSYYGYCDVCESGSREKSVSVHLPEYKNYHKSAKDGGRGYITISSDLFHAILNIKTLNALRLNLRGLLEADRLSYNSETMSSTTVSYKRLHAFLPEYCRPNVVRRALDEFSEIFTTTYGSRDVTFEIRSEFSFRHIPDSLKESKLKDISDFVGMINDVADHLATEKDDERKKSFIRTLEDIGVRRSTTYSYISLTNKDYEDLVSLAIQYDSGSVNHAVSQIYNDYFQRGIIVEKIGALVRSYIRRNHSILSAA